MRGFTKQEIADRFAELKRSVIGRDARGRVIVDPEAFKPRFHGPTLSELVAEWDANDHDGPPPVEQTSDDSLNG
jgi:hypothetical protein